MTITVTYTKTYTTDENDPILHNHLGWSQDDDSIAKWFAGSTLHLLLMEEGFGFTLEKEP